MPANTRQLTAIPWSLELSRLPKDRSIVDTGTPSPDSGKNELALNDGDGLVSSRHPRVVIDIQFYDPLIAYCGAEMCVHDRVEMTLK